MTKTIATATLLLASLLGGCDDSGSKLTPSEHEAVTDLDLQTADELIDPAAPEPGEEEGPVNPGTDTQSGPDELAPGNQVSGPNTSNVRPIISPGSACVNDSQCAAIGGRCDLVADYVDESGLTAHRCVGPCSVDADCEQGEECGSGGFCDVLTKGHWDFCINGGCERGQGDCDYDSDCEGNLSCIQQAGSAWGYFWGVDVCDYPAGHPSYCSAAHPCWGGQGDCDEHKPLQCTAGTVCKTNRGPEFGLAGWVDVCLLPWQ